jgi:acetyl-CoA carboxylase biotin carboxyl carrier protein
VPPDPDDSSLSRDPRLDQAVEVASRLAGLVAEGALHRIAVELDGARWEVESLPAPAATPTPVAPIALAPPLPHPGPDLTIEALPAAPQPAGQVVTAPLVGVFYRASGPGQDPFVEIGAQVRAGDQLGIIEAMKMMNEVTADVSGSVVAIHATDTDVVEFQQPLFTIDPSQGPAS